MHWSKQAWKGFICVLSSLHLFLRMSTVHTARLLWDLCQLCLAEPGRPYTPQPPSAPHKKETKASCLTLWLPDLKIPSQSPLPLQRAFPTGQMDSMRCITRQDGMLNINNVLFMHSTPRANVKKIYWQDGGLINILLCQSGLCLLSKTTPKWEAAVCPGQGFSNLPPSDMIKISNMHSRGLLFIYRVPSQITTAPPLFVLDCDEMLRL